MVNQWYRICCLCNGMVTKGNCVVVGKCKSDGTQFYKHKSCPPKKGGENIMEPKKSFLTLDLDGMSFIEITVGLPRKYVPADGYIIPTDDYDCILSLTGKFHDCNLNPLKSSDEIFVKITPKRSD